MIATASQRADAWLSASWACSQSSILRAMHRSRFVLAFLILAFSVADLLLTQTILTMVHEITGETVGEANALMAPIVMTWWAWPIRVGIPLIVVVRDLRQRNYSLMLTGCLLYGAVVAWNTRQYFLVLEVVQ